MTAGNGPSLDPGEAVENRPRLEEMARAQGLLWELARAKRSALTDDGQMYALLVPGDLLDRIDFFLGYDEMGQ